MKFLFIFLDGVGLGKDDPDSNPFAQADLPNLSNLLNGRRLIAAAAPFESQRASLLALDACLGVPGLPQSATGQAVLLSGINVPSVIGRHYGPKPTREIAAFLQNGNLFSRLKRAGRRVAFLNAYPPAYFESIETGRRMYAAIPLAAVYAGLPLYTKTDLHNGQAISADFTAKGWHTHLGLRKTPVIAPSQAGKQLADLAQAQDFSLFEYWLSDFAGHRQDMNEALQLLETFDMVLGELINAWDDDDGLILITSDHGNLEDLSTRHHTANPVPALIIGAPTLRRSFAEGLSDLTGITPAILRLLLNEA